MVLLKLISNVSDTVNFEVDADQQQTVRETRVVLQQLLGYDASLLTLTFRGSKLVDAESWEVMHPKAGEKLFASVNTAALNNQNNNLRSQNAGGGGNVLPGMGTAAQVNKEQEERDAVKRAESMEPMIEMMANNPATIDMMIASSPQLKQMIKDHPEVEKELKNPETLKMMMRAQLNPDARKEMNRSMQMQMAQLNTIPGGMAMLENKLGGMLNEQANYAPKSDADRQMASEENSTPQAGQSSNDRPLPNPFAQGVSNRGAVDSDSHRGHQQGMGDNQAMMNMLAGMRGSSGGVAGQFPNPMQMPTTAALGMGQPNGLPMLPPQSSQQMFNQPLGGGGHTGGGHTLLGGGGHTGVGPYGMNPLTAMMNGGAGAFGVNGSSGGAPPRSTGADGFPQQQRQPFVPSSSYEAQLRVLQDEMGFEDKELCLKALRSCGGNIDEAVEYLEEIQDMQEALAASRDNEDAE